MLYKVQDCHSLVHVTGEVSDTPLSQPLTAVMQSPRPMIYQYILLRLPLYRNGGVYIHIYVTFNVTTALCECSFSFEVSLVWNSSKG